MDIQTAATKIKLDVRIAVIKMKQNVRITTATKISNP